MATTVNPAAPSPQIRQVAEQPTLAHLLVKAANVFSNERDRLVLTRRFGLDGEKAETLADIGEWLGITRERVSQLQYRIVRRIVHPGQCLGASTTA